MVSWLIMMEMPFSFEKAVRKSLESKQPLEVEVIDAPITGPSGWDCPDQNVRKLIYGKKTEQLRYEFGGQVSNINEQPKFTRFVKDCTGLAVIGKDQFTGKQISFISHSKTPIVFDIKRNYWARLPKEEQERTRNEFDPFNRATSPYDNVKKYDEYERLLEEAMKKIRARCSPESIDAVIFGGQILEKKRMKMEQ